MKIVEICIIISLSLHTSIVRAHELPNENIIKELDLRAEAERFVREALRLHNEAERLRYQANRLIAEQERLDSEVGRIESEWQKAHAANPKKFPDSPGRDRSQQIMLADIKKMTVDINNLRDNAEQLEKDSQRLLDIANRLDPNIQLDILDTIIGNGGQS